MTHTQIQPREQIAALVEKYYNLSSTQREAVTEAGVVHQFIQPFLAALGWPVEDPQRFKYELSTYAGRPDMILMPENGDILYVEAKRFDRIQALAQAKKAISGIVTPGQMTLPGMAADRTAEEQQAINYAFENGGTWAILTNFEKLRLFNARRDWLVLSFEDPRAYLDEFDLLWQLAYPNICQGGLDALNNQRYREDIDSDYLNFINTWREKLAQDIVAHPNANPWAFAAGQIRLDDLRAVVQRVLDRLVVVRFAEDHLVIPGGTLYSFYQLSTTNAYTFTLTEFFHRLYRRFDESHNSALFAPHLADQAVFSEDILSGLIEKLYEARYRAMSADIMGNTYEQYLGQTLVLVDDVIQTADNLETRKKQGSYYTPQVIVRHLVDRSLGRYLYGTSDGAPVPAGKSGAKTAAEIRDLRVLDLACGSGSFLIYAYEVLAKFYRREIARLESEIQRELDTLARIAAAGDSPMAHIDVQIKLAPLRAELARLQDYPRIILETHLYGVDMDPQAAEIATVNLMMRAMADQRGSQRRLPLILNQNIKVGNSLIGAGPGDPLCIAHADCLAELARLRLSLAVGGEGSDAATETDAAADNSVAAEDYAHDVALHELHTKTARMRDVCDAALVDYFTDSAPHRLFHWPVEFPEVFVGQHHSSAEQTAQAFDEGHGFDIIIGNPPWEIIKPNTREFFAYRFEEDIWRKYSRREADKIIAQLLEDDHALAEAWEMRQRIIKESTTYYRNSDAYIHQGRGDANTYKLFLERAYSLLRAGGRLGYVIPSGIYTDLGTLELRKLLFYQNKLEYLLCFANNRRIFPEVHPSFRFVLLGFEKGGRTSTFHALFLVTVEDAVGVSDFNQVVEDSSNFINISVDEVQRLSPENLVLLELKSKRDLEILSLIYANKPLLGYEVTNTWNISLARELDMTNHRHLFNEYRQGWPVYEGRMIDQFDHRVAYWVSGHGRSAKWYYASEPERFSPDYPWRAQYYIDPQDALERQEYLYGNPKWRVGLCMVTAPTNRRTVIASMLPMKCGVGNSITTLVVSENDPRLLLYVLAVLNSLTLDYAMRFRIKLNLNFFIISEIPLPRLVPGDPSFDAIVPRAARLTCTTADFAPLWETVMQTPWQPSQAVTDSAERRCIRDELDAIIAHLYGLNRDGFAYILDTFPLVFPSNEVGDAKKARLLHAYDVIQV